MRLNYKISGMTCDGCRTNVEKALNNVNGVEKATVNLKNEEAIIEMEKQIPIEIFQKEISNKYTIKIKELKVTEIVSNQIIEKPKSGFRQLLPLFLIIGYISIASLLINRTSLNLNSFMLDFMGLFYIVFSFFKLLDLKGFPDSFSMYDPIAKKIPIYGWIYPFVETALGLLFLLRFKIELALIITIIVLVITTIGVTKILIDKKSIQCACLGTALKLPMTKATFIENAIMLFMAFWMLSN
ncbi:heavy-metal-associated domain-containing protein [Lutibacter flavus]|uniref:Heavy-metal-associated domain-containing protein n=1 Tax=Lutibacter flavus TaxID=691689 RepID=A0A238YJF2_9FLAO|nr:heavy metal-associated domain-containing protein [Lutibacter flavus]SNR70743.1 Heavy-metal-associated domain-containing protein [Lutibacter flavus]